MTDRGTTQALVCPKCQGPMRPAERSGVIIDQCGNCRGIFLDRGELERLVEAEDAHYGAGPGGGQPPPGYPPSQGPPPRRRRSGFLGELFDF